MAEKHPIEGLMNTAMQSIKDMVDVNTIVGDAVQSPDGTVIIPISRVSFGFAAGGGEYTSREGERKGEGEPETKPFAGGSGAGVTINPVAFMVVGNNQIRLLPVDSNAALERILEIVPELLEKINDAFRHRENKHKLDKGKPENVRIHIDEVD